MKRSRSLKLALMGASALTLSACEEAPQDVAIFKDVLQCENEVGFDRDACIANFEQAKQEHVRVAPKYTSAEDCEADFGAAQCETAPQKTQSGGSVFMPLMMGYMMGSMLSNGSRAATQPPLPLQGRPEEFPHRRQPEGWQQDRRHQGSGPGRKGAEHQDIDSQAQRLRLIRTLDKPFPQLRRLMAAHPARP